MLLLQALTINKLKHGMLYFCTAMVLYRHPDRHGWDLTRSSTSVLLFGAIHNHKKGNKPTAVSEAVIRGTVRHHLNALNTSATRIP